MHGDTETKEEDISRWRRGHARGRPKDVCWILCATRSYYNFGQRTFWKQELGVRIYRVEERIGEEMSRNSEFRSFCKEVWLKERMDSSITC